jgi:hypothetical protein
MLERWQVRNVPIPGSPDIALALLTAASLNETVLLARGRVQDEAAVLAPAVRCRAHRQRSCCSRSGPLHRVRATGTPWPGGWLPGAQFSGVPR